MPGMAYSNQPAAEPLTKYGQMRLDYLKTYKPLVYSRMLEHGELYPHCLEIQQKAIDHLTLIMEHFKAKNPQPNNAEDRLAWENFQNACRRMAEDIIRNQLVCH